MTSIVADPNIHEAQRLRAAMVDEIVRRWATVAITISDPVLTALGVVPREVFVPEVSLTRAYEDDIVAMKLDPTGRVLSSVSAPNMIALMLTQLNVRPGHRVLEIGSGGYQAAVIAELAGPAGVVTSVDIDPHVITRARTALDQTPNAAVHTHCGDGEFGHQATAPFDRIIVSVEAVDLAPAWRTQLAPGGRLVVPLRVGGFTRSVTFVDRGDHWASLEHHMCGFVPMQGAGRLPQRTVRLCDGAWELSLDEPGVLDVDPSQLEQALRRPGQPVWSGVFVGNAEPFDELDLWLAGQPSHARLRASDSAVAAGVAPRWATWNPPTLLGPEGIAYRVLREVDPDTHRHEFGAIGHGPVGAALAEVLVARIRAWERQQRGKPAATILAFPRASADLPPGPVADRRHSRIVLSWSNPP